MNNEMLVWTFMRQKSCVQFATALGLLMISSLVASADKPKIYGFEGEATPYFALSADGETVHYASRLLFRGAIEFKSGKLLSQSQLDGTQASNALIAPNNKFWVSTSRGDITIHDIVTNKELHKITSKTRFIHSVSVRADGEQLAIVSEDAVELYRVTDGKRLRSWPSVHNRVALSADGELVATCCPDGGVDVRSVSGEKKLSLKLNVDKSLGLYCLAFTPDSSMVLIGSLDGQVWNIRLASSKAELLYHPKVSVLTLGINADGTLAAVGTVHGEVFIVELSTKKLFQQIKGLTSEPGALLFSRDSSLIVVGCQDGSCSGYRVKDAKKIWKVNTLPKSEPKE
jgi:WD40 repeat protein